MTSIVELRTALIIGHRASVKAWWCGTASFDDSALIPTRTLFLQSISSGRNHPERIWDAPRT
jgi:hypothetical protein